MRNPYKPPHLWSMMLIQILYHLHMIVFLHIFCLQKTHISVSFVIPSFIHRNHDFINHPACNFIQFPYGFRSFLQFLSSDPPIWSYAAFKQPTLSIQPPPWQRTGPNVGHTNVGRESAPNAPPMPWRVFFLGENW